jgi:glycosyltransferase involved in cell wall biosynthesis
MVDQQPLVSVCVPTYNYGRFIGDCIRSVLAQTYQKWELIITDDDSDDNTRAVVGKYSALDCRIRYLVNPARLSMNPNIREACSHARGKYIKVLCADDWIAPGYLTELVRLMEAYQGVSLATSAEIYCDHDGKPLRKQFLFGRRLTIRNGRQMLDAMARGSGFGGNSSFLIRAESYRQVGGYDATVPYAADYELAARLCQVGDYLHLDEPLFFGRGHESSSSSQDPKKLRDVTDWFDIPARIFAPRPALSRNWVRHHWRKANLTAQYLVTCITQLLRANRTYPAKLWPVLIERGNLLTGALLVPFHLPARLLNPIRRLTQSTW